MCYCVSLSVPVILSLPWQVWYSRLDSIARNGEGKQIGSVVKIKEVHVVCRLRKFCVFRICHFPVLRYFGLWLPTISANENSGVRGEATKSAFPSLKKTWFCRTCAVDFLYCEPFGFLSSHSRHAVTSECQVPCCFHQVVLAELSSGEDN